MLGNLNKTAYQNHKSPAFGNGLVTKILTSPILTGGFTFLEQNPAWEIVGLDFATMIAPRTYIDYKQNPDYGREAAFRETSSIVDLVFVPAAIGGVAMWGKKYGGLHTNSNTLTALHEAWKNAKGATKEEKAVNYLNEVFKSAKGQDGTKWKSLYDSLIEKFGKTQGEEKFNTFVGKAAKIITDGSKDTSELSKIFKEATHAAGNVKVKIGKHEFGNSIENILRDTIGAAQKVFIKNEEGNLPAVVEDLCKFFRKKSIAAATIAVVGGFGLHFMNETITKMKTGSTKFTGYKDFGQNNSENEKDTQKSSNFIAKKALATAGMALITLGSMGAFKKDAGFLRQGVKKGWDTFVKSIELNGPFPNMNLIKLILGSVLTGRFVMARDKTELQVSTYRDYSTFFNLLVVGPLITKGVTQAIDKTLVNGKAAGKGLEKVLSWFGSDVSAKTISEIQTKWPGNKSKMAVYNGCKALSLGWQLFALGIGMPYILNKFIIDKSGNGNTKNTNSNKNTINDFITKHKQVYANYGGLITHG
ncbi:MAG: hypothetical protein A2Y25_05280 [Candidatus Melainabacteria bacterium GWF2_37_15]|nr:MAG: hypothetical protein A2Y25_05280 [Candidatus Melainabacteria bacterium GWF2_37_15]